MRGSRSALVLAMVLREDDRHIGNISLQAIDWIDRSAEFAILLGDRTAWGKGYSKEAAYLICLHGFRERTCGASTAARLRITCRWRPPPSWDGAGRATSRGTLQTRRVPDIWEYGAWRSLREVPEQEMKG